MAVDKYHPRDFDFDIMDGELVEGLVKELLSSKSGSTKFEIKADKKAKTTGNLFFEYKNRGELSGLSTTKADWFVVSFWEHDNKFIVFLKTDRLKKRLRWLLKIGRATITFGGDANMAKGLLVRIQDLLSDYE